MLAAGSRVRLKGDPSVVGFVTAKPPFERANRTFIEVELPTGKHTYPANQLESAEAPPDALADFSAGKLSAPADLRRALTHLRMTGRLADMIYSMGATNTEFHAYQFKPVLKLLNAPSRGLLIADEVGLGKTIEAGLIWTELVARFDCRRLLVICPRPLVQKWRDELRSKFNVDARACGATELLDLLRDDAERREGFAAVASMSALRPPRGWNDPAEPEQGPRAELARLLADTIDDELFDLVIFDEAHHLRNTETMNHRLGQLVTSVADYKLFLSATPINLRANDLRALLKLIDPDTFEREWLFDLLQQENAPLVAAWEALRDPRVPLSQVKTMVDELPPGEVLKTGERLKRLRAELAGRLKDTPARRVSIAARLEEMSLLGSIVNRTRRRDVAEIKVERRPKTARWSMTDVERSFYDRATERIEQYAFERDLNERFLLAQSQRLVASSLAAAYRHWGERSGALSLDEEDNGNDKRLPGPLVSALGDVCDSPDELAELEASDTKFDRLVDLIKGLRQQDPEQKLIIFSSFRRTIDYLARRLAARDEKVLQLHGGVEEDRQETVEKFADAPAGTILLTSEVGGEGLDLQFCRTLINWDLPWNPMKVEQRIGRIDRIGQTSPTIEIVNLIAENTIEEIVYDRLYVRLDIIRQTLGDFEPILGEIVRDIELMLADPNLTVDERKRELERAMQAAEQRKREAEQLEREAPGLIAHGDSILQKVRDAQAPYKTLTPSDLRDYIAGTLTTAYEGSRFDPIAQMPVDAYEVRLSPRAQAEFSRFRERSARRYPTRFSRDAASGVRSIFGRNPDPGRYRGLEAIPMTHPLARFAAKNRDERQKGITARPATSFEISVQPEWNVAVGDYVIAVERWSIDAVLPVDRLSFAGANLASGEALPGETVERMLMEALACEPALRRLDQPDLERAQVVLSEVVLPQLTHEREDFEEAEAARHYDLSETQEALIEQHRERRRSEANGRILELRLAGGDNRMRIARLEQAKLDKFLARMDLKLEEIKKREAGFNLEEPILVGLAVINVRGLTQ